MGEEGQEGAEEGNGWTLLPEGEEEDADGPYDNGLSLREPVVIDDARTVLVVARGGAAGVGNKVMMRSKSARAGGGTQQLQSMVSVLATTTALADSLLTLPISQPKTYLPGGHGDHRSLLLELKIIADVGLVGFPNVSAFIHLVFFCVTLTLAALPLFVCLCRRASRLCCAQCPTRSPKWRATASPRCTPQWEWWSTR